MKTLRYIEGVATLELDTERCTGCGVCTLVCPHAVFEIAEKRARIVDLDGCMECGACATNCAWNAISLTPGVGCAAAIINGWIHNTEPSCGGPDGCCSTPAAPEAAEEPAEPSGCCGGATHESAACCGGAAEEPSGCCGGATESPAETSCGCGSSAEKPGGKRAAAS